jgi:hypothetical protein
MRNRFAAALSLLLLTAAGCASSRSDSGLGNATAKLADPEILVKQISTVPSAARHVEGGLPVRYVVRISNRSGEPITLKRIDAVSLGEGAYRLPSVSRPFNKQIQPEHYEQVDFWAPAFIDNATITGANGPVTLRLTTYFDSPVGQFQNIVVQQVHEDMGDPNVPQ